MAEPLKLPILSIDKLSLSLSGKSILKSIDLNIYPNEIMALVGESGSGKSVTAQAVMGLLPQKSCRIERGSISFNGQSIPAQNSAEWQSIRGAEIGMIFQEPLSSLNPSMRCGKQVAEVAIQHRPEWSNSHRKQKVLEAFKAVNLPDPERVFRAYPHQLSGGQKQRVMIAMALLCEPSLLIADEPTTALDVLVQLEIIQLIQSLQQKNKMSVLFISHDLSLVAHLADRVAVMQNGSVVEENKTQALLSSPQHPYTQGLLASRPKTNERIRYLPTLHEIETGKFKPEVITAAQREEEHSLRYQSEPLLTINNLYKVHTDAPLFGGKVSSTHAVKNVSFSLYAGETLGLVGASGCGKSSLARALIFLDPPTKGTVKWKGNEIASKDKAAIAKFRKKVQFIFQDPFAALHPLKTIGKAIEDVVRKHTTASSLSARSRAEELLTQVGMDKSLFDRYPHQLSGGQRQRAVIARALAVEPQLLICDESVAALDISVQATVLNLLNYLKDTLNLSYLFISHDLGVVKHMADRILVMHNGEIVEENEADTLYNNPKTTYSKALLNAAL